MSYTAHGALVRVQPPTAGELAEAARAGSNRRPTGGPVRSHITAVTPPAGGTGDRSLVVDAPAGAEPSELARARQELTVEAAIKIGKITRAGRATWLARMAEDEAGTTAVLERLAVGDLGDARSFGAVLDSFGLGARP